MHVVSIAFGYVGSSLDDTKRGFEVRFVYTMYRTLLLAREGVGGDVLCVLGDLSMFTWSGMRWDGAVSEMWDTICEGKETVLGV